LQVVDKIVLLACGTSWHAALVGKYMLEKLCRLPVEVDYASEYRYRDPLVTERTLAIFVSQSGETADTLAALKEVKALGGTTLTICNVVESSMARASDAVLYTHAGPEIGVASTKAFTTQLVALALFACHLAQLRHKMVPDGLTEALAALPRQLEQCLEMEPHLQQTAVKIADFYDVLYLGRGVTFPIALEGALKLKEISYIHAEGYPAGEMKHGPIALIDDGVPVVMLAPYDAVLDKVKANMQEVQARGGQVIGISDVAADDDLRQSCEDLFVIPQTHPLLSPILAVVPLQLLAYHVAVVKGTDVDQPRNLAKSVTVE